MLVLYMHHFYSLRIQNAAQSYKLTNDRQRIFRSCMETSYQNTAAAVEERHV